MLRNLIVSDGRAQELKEASRDWPSWDLTERQICDLELLLNGAFSPLAGFVASEVTKNGGIALCAPIAPYGATQREVRALVESGGGFILVHVAHRWTFASNGTAKTFTQRLGRASSRGSPAYPIPTRSPPTPRS